MTTAPEQCSIRASRRAFENVPNFSKLSDDRRISRETDGYNENCLGVRFALCIKLRDRKEHEKI